MFSVSTARNVPFEGCGVKRVGSFRVDSNSKWSTRSEEDPSKDTDRDTMELKRYRSRIIS